METVATLTMNPSIDVSGEVDELAPERKLRSHWRQVDPGGGGVNVARGIRRCGGNVQAVYPAGGATGSLLNELLDEEGIERHSVTIKDYTRQNFDIHVRASGDLYHFVMPGPMLTCSEADRCIDAVADLDPAPGLLVASGSLPPGVDSGFYGRIAQICRQRGSRLILDTSGTALHAALQEPVYLIKPNEREFATLAGEELAGTESRRLEQARKILDRTEIEVLVVTLGEEGALLATRQQQVRMRPPHVELVSPVGAGDSFVALLTQKLAAGLCLKESVRYGVAAAAAAVMTPGSSLYELENVNRLYSRVTDEEVH
jgi:6-phosphofructokinase 2